MRSFILKTFTDDEAETCLRCHMPELVHCKYCKHNKNYQNGEFFGCELGNGLHEPDWYCADGMKKEGEKNEG